MQTKSGKDIPAEVFQALVDWLGFDKTQTVIAEQLGWNALDGHFYIPNYCGMYVGIELDGYIHS